MSRIAPAHWPAAIALSAPDEPASRTCVPTWCMLATAGVLACSIAISIAAALTRGPWIDEFWTLWATDPTIPWGDALRQRWLTDVHPPLYYATSRLMAGWLGNDIAMRRLQNVPALVGLALFFVYADAAWPRARRFLAVYAVLAFSSYFTTGYVAEYRSYHLQFCFGIVFYGCLYAVLRDGPFASHRERKVAWGLLAISSVWLVNLHFVTTILTVLSLAGISGFALLLRDRRTALLLWGIIAIALVPLAVTTAVQAHYLVGRVGGHFWIKTGVLEALAIIAGSLSKGIGLNVVVLLVAARVLLRAETRTLLGVTVRTPGRLGLDSHDADIVIGAGFVVIAVASLGAVLVANVYTPIIIDRYLVLCSSAFACGLSLIASKVLFGGRSGFALLVGNAALFLIVAGVKLIDEPRWNASAALIAEHVAACPQTRVRPFPFPYVGSLANEAKVLNMAHHVQAERFGFSGSVVEVDAKLSASAAQPCPLALWTENVDWKREGRKGDNRFLFDAAAAALGPLDLSGVAVERTKTGAVILLPQMQVLP